MTWLQAVPPAVCYFLFNWQFFRSAESILSLKPLHKVSIILTFALNYSIFILCSMLSFHLILNWIIFLVLLLVEQMVLYHLPPYKCALLALLGTQLGLAINILCRSLIAILMHIPLVAFDNEVSNPGNMKRYPVLLGFLVVGILFFCTARFHLLNRLSLVVGDRSTLFFLLGLLVAMYFYLCMNLMVYYIEDNNIMLKLWSMKSAIFVIVGECLSVAFSIQLGQISVYRTNRQLSQEQLAKEQLLELELRTIATTDPLTGRENRHQAEPRLNAALNSGRVFCLGFVDLNGLKTVNDRYGHKMGDHYIQAVSSALSRICAQDDYLFRYGGDEFLLLLFDTTLPDATERLQQAQQHLEQESHRCAYPFTMGISFGIAVPDADMDALRLIQAADDSMYQMKRSRHK